MRKIAILLVIVCIVFLHSYTLLAADFVGNGDGTVTDNETGLMWLEDTQYVEVVGAMIWDEAVSYCEGGEWKGYDDWRLPEVQELVSLVDYSQDRPATDNAFFPNTLSSSTAVGYWSATPMGSSSSTSRRYVAFYDGVSYGEDKSMYTNYVRCVRAGEFAPSHITFVDNQNGTVVDHKTGLMWLQESQGNMTWDIAFNHCDNGVWNDYDDWRLPEISDLFSVVDFLEFEPAANIMYFPDTPAHDGYWSATDYAINSGLIWIVNFHYGNTSYFGKTNTANVRCMRGYHPWSEPILTLSTPKAGAKLIIGDTLTVTWDPLGQPSNVRLFISYEGGKAGSWLPLTDTETGIPNEGSFDWTITGPESFNCAIKVESVSDPSAISIAGLFTVLNTKGISIRTIDIGHPNRRLLSLQGEVTIGTNDTVIDIPTTWTISNDIIGTINENRILTAQPNQNGYVEASTTHMGKTYTKGVFLYTSGGLAEADPNNTAAEADIVWGSWGYAAAENSFYESTLPEGDPADYFRIPLTSDKIVDIGFFSHSSVADTLVQLVRIPLDFSSETVLASAISTDGELLMFTLGLITGDYKYFLKLTIAEDGDPSDGNPNLIVWRVHDDFPADGSSELTITEPTNISQDVIHNLKDESSFTFTLTETTAVRILFTPSGGVANYHVELLDESLTEIDSVDCPTYTPVTLESIYGPGDYILKITSIDAVDAISPFSVELSISDKQLEQEPNDLYTQATPWDTVTPISGRLNDSLHTDFYTFDIPIPQYVTLGLTAPNSSKDFTLSLYRDSDQNQIDGISSTSGSDISLHMGLAVGRYYLKLSSAGDPETIHPYTLSLVDSTVTDLEIEANNTIKFANGLEKDLPLRGRIFQVEDKDYYGFKLPSFGSFTVDFVPTTTTGDYSIYTVDDSGAQSVLFNSTDGAAQNQSSFRPPGNYYLLVEGNGDIDQYNPYQLSITSTLAIEPISQIVSVLVTPTSSEMSEYDTQNLNAVASYSDATLSSITDFNWHSLDESVATVNTSGVVTAVAPGKVTIVASLDSTVSDATGKVDLTVTGTPANTYSQHHGNLILVAGGGPDDQDTLFASTQYLSDLVYLRFRQRFFEDNDIFYFNPITASHDIDGDGYDNEIVDNATILVSDFTNSIDSWAPAQDTDGPLYIYLLDHGGTNTFKLNEGQILGASGLNGLKESIQAFRAATGRDVFVMIEACKSGTFTDDIMSLNDDGVAIITSTGEKDTYIQFGGKVSFSQFFADQLVAGKNVKEAFDNTALKLGQLGPPYSTMEPQLIQGANLIADTTVVGGNFGIGSLFPQFNSLTASITAITANTPVSFFAMLEGLDPIQKVWSVVRPPNYKTPDVVLDNLAPPPQQEFFEYGYSSKLPEGYQYSASYNQFSNNGTYAITSYAINENNNITLETPINIVVTGGVPMPDLNGDNVIDIVDAIIGLRTLAGYDTGSAIVADYANAGVDMDGDNKLGLAEVIAVLQDVGEPQ